jgi:hypothetical protein
MDDKEIEELVRLTGMSPQQITESAQEAGNAINIIGYLIGFWSTILEAMDNGDIGLADATSTVASAYIATINEEQLRWIVAASTRAIALKLRAEHTLQDMDPVAAAEKLLRESSG